MAQVPQSPLTLLSPEEELVRHLSNAKGLLFDCDGTLLDTMPVYYLSWKSTLADFDLPPLLPERFYSFGGMPVADIFALLLTESGKYSPSDCLPVSDVVKRLESTKRAHHERLVSSGLSHASPIPCVVGIATSSDLPMAVASSGWRDHVLSGLSKAGIETIFKSIVTAEDPAVKAPKPAPDIWFEAALRIGVSPSECVGFEDSPLGMESLRRAGVLYACDVTQLYAYPRNVEKREEEAKAKAKAEEEEEEEEGAADGQNN